MNKQTKGRVLFILFVLALCAAAYFAADLPFFQYDDPLARATLTVAEDGEGLCFSYENDAITLHGGGGADLYALTVDGTVAVEDAYLASLPSDFLGSFAAVRTVTQDADGDGTAQRVIQVAKTDMEFTQGYSASANAFLSAEIPFEVVYTDRESFTVYLDAQPLPDAYVTITLPDGTEQTVTTDKNGVIEGLDLNDVRSGVRFTYIDDSAVYTLHYQVEADTILTIRWLTAMLPFGLIVLVAAVCIAVDIWLRKRLYRKENTPAGKTGVTAKDTRKKQRVFGFETVRWTVMALSFALLVFGSRLTGTVFSNVQLPIFACPYNLDQLTGAGCYLLSHPDVLLASSWQEILGFFGTFAVCAVLFGRILCGFVCPLGLLQDVVHQVRQALHAEGIALNERLYAVLRMVKWVMMIIFLGIGLVGGSFCDFCPAMALSPAFAGFKLSLGFSGFVMVAVLVSGFFKRRCFCNICPMGFVLGLPHKLSLFKLKKDAVACTECGACYEACPMGVKSVFTVREGKGDVRSIDVTTTDCIMCGECIRRCPENNALAMTFCGKKIYTANRMKFMRSYAPPQQKNKKGRHQR